MDHICRFCLKVIANENKVVPIISIDSNGVDVTTLVKTLVPEIYIGVSENPVLCQRCYNTVSKAYSFRLLCLRSENLIGIYMRETQATTKTVDLHRVVNYWKTVYKTNRRDKNVTKTNLAEWFGVEDVQSIVEQSADKPAKKLPMCGMQGKKRILSSKHSETDIPNLIPSELETIQIAATQPCTSNEKNNDSTGITTENEASKCLDINVLKEPPKGGSSFLRLCKTPIDLCGCPPSHDCPTNVNFNFFVDEKRRETMRKKHTNCDRLCQYRHMRTCKFYIKMQPETATGKLDIPDRAIEASHGSNIEKLIGALAEKNETTCNAEGTPDDKNDEEDEIDVLSLLQQLQENENLEKLGLMENETNLQDLYEIKKIFDEKDHSFSYALIPKSAAEDQSPEEKSLLKNNVQAVNTKTCSNEAGANSAILNSIIAPSPEKDCTEKANNKTVETITRRKSFSKRSDLLFTPLEIKKEPADEDTLSSILGVSPEDLPITVTKPIEQREKDPLDISNSQTERPFIRVRPVESLKPTCSLTVEPLPVADSLNLVIPEPSTSVAFPNLMAGSVPPLPAIVGLIENNLPPPILSPISDINPEGNLGSYVSQRPLYTTSSPPPLHLCVSKLPNSNLSNSKKRKAPKAAPKKPTKRRQTKKSKAEKLSEYNPEPSVAIPLSLEMPKSMDCEDDIVIKNEPLEYNDEGDDFEHLDKALSKRPREETSNLSKLIVDPPMNEDQLDIPEYIQIKNVSLVNISDLAKKDIQAKKREPKPPKAVDNISSIRLPQSLSELLDAKPNKTEPEVDEPLDLFSKAIEDDPSYDADSDPLYLPPAGFRQRKRDFKRFIELSDEEKAKRMRRSNRIRRKKVDKFNMETPKVTRRKAPKTEDKLKCVLPTKFTRDGDYVNDHDYFISPYARNRMASVRRKGGEHCICLLCDLIHLSSKHSDHMTAHYTKCAICGADFENVFVLNMHVRKHTSHCRECKLSVTYSRFLHHAETHNRTPGMSEILLPLPPKFPLSEKDFLDDFSPTVPDAFTQKRKMSSPNTNAKKSKRAAGKEPRQMEKNAFCKTSPITLTELLKSSRPTNIKSIMTDKQSVSNSSGSTKTKTKSVNHRKKTKTANQKKGFTTPRMSKIVDEIVNSAKELNSRRSEIIESHVYTKEVNSGDGQENKKNLYSKTYENSKYCPKYRTGSVSMQKPFNTEAIEEKAALVDKSHDPPSSDNINLTDDASSLTSKEPLGIKVDQTVISQMPALAATNTLESHSKSEVPIAEEAAFKLTNKITWKRPTNLKQTENEAQDNPKQSVQTDCYVDFTDMSSTGHTATVALPTEKLPENVEQVADLDAHISASNLKPIGGTNESIKTLTSADVDFTDTSGTGHTATVALPTEKLPENVEQVANLDAHVSVSNLKPISGTDDSIKTLISAVLDDMLTPSTATEKKVICKEKVAKIAAYLKTNIEPSIPRCPTSETSTADADVEPLPGTSNEVSSSTIEAVDNNVIAVESPLRGDQNKNECIDRVEETRSSLAENIPKSNE